MQATNFTLSKDEAENDDTEKLIEGIDLAIYKKIIPKGERLPIPRRDHSAALIKNEKFLLIYGGKNDNAHELTSENSNAKESAK